MTRHPITVENARFYVHNLYTRFPFKYGIASLTALPHLFVELQVRIGGGVVKGLAAEHLPPKWFTKNPETTFEEDVPDLIRVVTHAGEVARGLGDRERPFFAFWKRLCAAQEAWAEEESLAPLLANLGVSMVERAVIDALCRHWQRPFGALLRENVFGIELGEIRPELAGMTPAAAIPLAPLREVAVRHTIGLGDPLTVDEIPEGEALHDGLPHALRDCVRVYGCRYFKIKLCGDLELDGERLRRLAGLFEELLGDDYHFTLDGNENYRTVEAFVSHWERHMEEPLIDRMMRQLLFVEQPLHREVALSGEVGEALALWNQRPSLIIDESDGTMDSLPRAVALGYSGTSHKNCKGVIKGLVNAAWLARRRETHPDQSWILSGEDLANVGPLALLQDLSVMASLGIGHVERNGHHYFKGLAAYPEELQRAVVRDHGDLYAWGSRGYATLNIREGRLSTRSVTQAPFGLASQLNLSKFTALEDWDIASLKA